MIKRVVLIGSYSVCLLGSCSMGAACSRVMPLMSSEILTDRATAICGFATSPNFGALIEEVEIIPADKEAARD